MITPIIPPKKRKMGSVVDNINLILPRYILGKIPPTSEFFSMC
jgi:hypothetical protein